MPRGPPDAPWRPSKVVDSELALSPEARVILRTRTVARPAFESAKRRVDQGLTFGVAGRIWDRTGRTLLVHPAPSRGWGDVWVVPGGGSEVGETPRQTLHREVREETGGSIHNERLWRVYHEVVKDRSGRSLQWSFLQYVGLWAGGVPRPMDRSEIERTRWFWRLPKNTAYRRDWVRAPRPKLGGSRR